MSTDSPERPIVRCLVTRPIADGIWEFPTCVTLEVAADLETGYVVIVDPFDMETLTRWEQVERSKGVVREWPSHWPSEWRTWL